MTNAIRDPDGTLHLPARTIPIPRHISAEAKRALTQPGIVMPREFPPLDDTAGWRKIIAEGDADIARLFSRLPPFPVRIETVDAGSARIHVITPENVPAEKQNHAILYLHGGGFVYGGGELAAQAPVPLAAFFQCRIYSVDYRMPPDHPFPAALEDAVAAYRKVLEHHAPGKIAIMGVSAGGNLTATCILKARDLGLPLPGAAIMNTPATDATQGGDTWDTHQDIDVVLTRRGPYFEMYANGHDVHDPYLSPVFGDFSKGFPPTLLISGTRDVLLSDTVRMHRALRKARIKADLHVFEAMPHGGFFGAPEDLEALIEQSGFLDANLE